MADWQEVETRGPIPAGRSRPDHQEDPAHARRGVSPALVLGSTSPRRRELLQRHGFDFTTSDPGLDDAELRAGSAASAMHWAGALAFLKASAAAARLSNRSAAGSRPIVVIGADTIVVKGNTQIGKPADPSDAERIIRLLANTDHDVLTGVALLDTSTGRRELFVDRATVAVGPLSDSLIAEHVASGAWKGKAGGYNLSEQVSRGWPLVWTGDPTTVVGLPMRQLVPRLARFAGIVPNGKGFVGR